MIEPPIEFFRLVSQGTIFNKLLDVNLIFNLSETFINSFDQAWQWDGVGADFKWGPAGGWWDWPLRFIGSWTGYLVQEERMWNVIQGKEVRCQVKALAGQTGARMKGHEIKNKSICANCNRSGQDDVGCFLLIGYPDSRGERPRFDDKAG